MKKVLSIILATVIAVSCMSFSVSAGTVKVYAPQMKSVTATDLTKFKINWSKVKRCSGYILYCKKGSGDFKTLKRLNKNTTSYTHTNLQTGTKYAYKVRAYTKQGNRIYYSKYSNAIAKKCTNYLLDIVSPYEKPYYYDTNNIIMGGTLYKHGFKCMGYGDKDQGNVTSFNLKGKYSKLSFVSGIIDNCSDLNDATIYIYTDGDLAEQFTIKSNELPKYHSVDITNCFQLRICVYSGRFVAMYDSDYGIANIKLYK